MSTAFVSYSWDDDEHKAWARAIAERLRSDSIYATIDQWATVPGDQLPEFMERAIAENLYVLIVCTPRYKSRSERREGGVGYEGDIITAELLQSRNHRKFIPILRKGEWQDAAPSWLAGKYYIELSTRISSARFLARARPHLLSPRSRSPLAAKAPRQYRRKPAPRTPCVLSE